MADDPKQSLVARSTSTDTSKTAIYHDSSTRSRNFQMLFISTVVLMVVITLALSIYRGVVLGRYGALYFMLGVCLIGLVAVELVLVALIRYGDLPKSKLWFLYFMGLCIIVEAIFTNVLLFKS